MCGEDQRWKHVASRIALLGVIILFGYSAYSYLLAVYQANDLFENPIPTPNYLARLVPSPGSQGPFGGSVCFALLSSQLSEPGNQVDELIDHLVAHQQLTVDGQRVLEQSADIFSLSMLEFMYDEHGNYIGTSGGSLEICYATKLTEGLHTAKVEVSSMSGKLYSYTWAFDIR